IAHIGIFFAALIWLGLVNVGTSRFIAQPMKIPTGAMEPTLMGSRNASTPDHVITDRTAYWFGNPKRGDLAIFSTVNIRRIESNPRYPGPVIYVKRVVGLPGENIEIRDGEVYANGNVLGSDHGIPPITYAQNKMMSEQFWAVPEGAYFVLGDNSPNSSDSRYWGFVPRENFQGKVTRIYWPFSRIGKPTYLVKDAR
ncbi:MAG: signal peptidase I, partial [Verrucomicrobiota bacterium]